MRIPRVRFTVRRMMVAVAIVAVLFATFEAGRRWERGRPLTIYTSSYRVRRSPGAAKAAGSGRAPVSPSSPIPVAPDPPEPE